VVVDQGIAEELGIEVADEAGRMVEEAEAE